MTIWECKTANDIRALKDRIKRDPHTYNDGDFVLVAYPLCQFQAAFQVNS